MRVRDSSVLPVEGRDFGRTDGGSGREIGSGSDGEWRAVPAGSSTRYGRRGEREQKMNRRVHIPKARVSCG